MTHSKSIWHVECTFTHSKINVHNEYSDSKYVDRQIKERKIENFSSLSKFCCDKCTEINKSNSLSLC